MSRTVLQIPMSKELREEAEKEALQQGFSSLQEAIRIFLKKLASKTIGVTIEDTIRLSPRAIKRYSKIDEDLKKGRNIYKAKDIDDLMRQLHENPLS